MGINLLVVPETRVPGVEELILRLLLTYHSRFSSPSRCIFIRGTN